MPKILRFIIANFNVLRLLKSKIKSKHRKGPNKLTESEALKILGLDKGSSEKIINKKYKYLMKYIHPDSGGSEYISKLINEAKDRLLK